MMRRVLRKVNSNQNSLVPKATELLRASTNGWTVDYFRTIVDSGVVPKAWVQDVLQYVEGDTSMIALQDYEFFEAAKIARPDLYAILDTTAGQAWIHEAMVQLTAAVPGYVLKSLFGGAK